MRQADRLIVNTASNYALSIVSAVASLIVVPVVVHDLGREGFGLASLLFAIWGVFQLGSNIVGRALERLIPHDRADPDSGRINRTFNASLWGFALIGSCGACVVFALRNWLIGGEGLSPIQIADGHRASSLLIAWIALGAPLLVYNKTLGAFQRYDLVGIFTASTMIARAIVVIVLFKLGYGSVTLFVGSQLAASLAESLLCRWALRQRASHLRMSMRCVDLQMLRLVAALSTGSLLMVAGNMLAAQGFVFFVGKRLGMRELGGLAIVLTVRRLLYMLLTNVSSVLTPAVSALDAANSSEHIAKLFVAAAKFGVVMAVAICLVPLTVAASGLRLWVGEEFLGLHRVLYIVLISLILLSPSSTSQQILMGLGKVRFTGPLVFLRGAIGLLAAYIFVETVSANLEGVVICAYGSQVLGGIILFGYAARVTRQPLLSTSMRVFAGPVLLGAVAASVTAAVAMGIGSQRWWQFITAVAVGEIVFLALVLAFALSREERHRFASFAQRVRARAASALSRRVQVDQLPVG